REIIQTNIFLNCPVVPNGSTVDPGVAQPEQAFFEGEIVTIVPYDVEDGEFNVQILFKFEDQDGFVLGRNPDGTPARSMTQTPGWFPIDLAPTAFFKPRTFQITEFIPAQLILVLEPFPIGSASAFPAIDPDDKGNVIPLILRDPFGPSNSSGEIIRIDQAELDAAFANNNPPQLPAPIEANFTALINEGLLEPEWAPGGRPYQERLALVGKALFKLQWTPEQGANQKDVTTCRACHSQPSDGASS